MNTSRTRRCIMFRAVKSLPRLGATRGDTLIFHPGRRENTVSVMGVRGTGMVFLQHSMSDERAYKGLMRLYLDGAAEPFSETDARLFFSGGTERAGV